MSGFGRTGEFFAHFKQNLNPDIITCAKGITSGYVQLGSVIVNQKVSKIFDNNPLMAGLTYSGHQPACTVANRCIDLYTQNNYKIIKDVNDKANLLNNYCNSIIDKYDFVNEYRNNGLMGCFELNITDNEQLENISNTLLDNNIYCLRIRSNIFTAPPLNIKNNVLEESINKIDKSFLVFNYF